MVVVIPGNGLLKKIKLGVCIAVLAVILFYILPKLVSQLWLFEQLEEKVKPNYLEKPLRVGAGINRLG